MKKTHSTLFRSRLRGSVWLACICLIMLLAANAQVALAQQAPVSTAPPSTGMTVSSVASSTSPNNDRYRIGPGDVLDIRVYNRPQLSLEAVRVDSRGMIRMPLIEDEIQAACRTELELSQEIETRYLKYQRNPHVDVFIKDYQSNPVAVIGAVDKPGRYQLQRRVRLLELLSGAGGPTEKAGDRIQVAHSADTFSCDASEKRVPEPVAADGSISYNLKETLRGDERANPYVRPGDVITVPEADEAYVVGNVFKPTAIPLKERITVSQAIAMAGGALRSSKKDQIKIVRGTPESIQKTEIYVDLNAISKHRAEDIALQKGDIVEVQTDKWKEIFDKATGGVTGAVTNLPFYILR